MRRSENGGLLVRPYSFVHDGNVYSYGSPLFPDLGLKENYVFWVCSHCLKKVNTAKEMEISMHVHRVLGLKLLQFQELTASVAMARVQKVKV